MHFVDWATEGDRRPLSVEILKKALRDFREEAEPGQVFASSNPALGILDKRFLFFDWFLGADFTPSVGEKEFGLEHHNEILRRFLCRNEVPFFLHDTTDHFLGIRWEGFSSEPGSDLESFAPGFLQPLKRSGPVDIYRVDSEIVCAEPLRRPPDPMAQPGPPDEPGLPGGLEKPQ